MGKFFSLTKQGVAMDDPIMLGIIAVAVLAVLGAGFFKKKQVR